MRGAAARQRLWRAANAWSTLWATQGASSAGSFRKASGTSAYFGILTGLDSLHAADLHKRAPRILGQLERRPKRHSAP